MYNLCANKIVCSTSRHANFLNIFLFLTPHLLENGRMVTMTAVINQLLFQKSGLDNHITELIFFNTHAIFD